MKFIIKGGILFIGGMVGVEFGYNGTLFFGGSIALFALFYLVLHAYMSNKRAVEHRNEVIAWNRNQETNNAHIERYEWNGKTMVPVRSPKKRVHKPGYYRKIWWKALQPKND